MEIDAIAREIVEREKGTLNIAEPSIENHRRPFIVGNWKMNKTPKETDQLLHELALKVKTEKVDVSVAPPSIYLDRAGSALAGSAIRLAAQNAHWENTGAFTGEISCSMLAELGINDVILGHSERRQLFGETSESILKKAKSACQHGLVPIICFGETLDQRQGAYLNTIQNQVLDCILGLSEAEMESAVLAYEPVWAIGTGMTASPEQAQEVHEMIRQTVSDRFSPKTGETIRILYGGSVNQANAKKLMNMNDIDGALVGGASLNANDFASICQSV